MSESHPAHSIVQDDVPLSLLCKWGQDAVHDIISKTAELFNLLKVTQPPNGSQMSVPMEDRKIKIEDYQKTIELLFKELKLIFERCLQESASYEFIQIERLIPLKEDTNLTNRPVTEEKSKDNYLLDERKKQLAILQSKNAHLKMAMDNLRDLVWDIDTMLAMRSL